jgi:hypothetical protein
MEADVAVATDRTVRDEVPVTCRWGWRCTAPCRRRDAQHERGCGFGYQPLCGFLFLSRGCRLPGVAVVVVVSTKEIRCDLAGGHQFVHGAMKRQHAAAENENRPKQEWDGGSRQPGGSYGGSIHDL